MSTYLAGMGTGLSLIIAIGAQNAFVLRQGLLCQHVFAVCLFCALSDAVLIGLGVGGADAIGEKLPWLMPVMRYGGAAFLLWYGLRSFRSAMKGGEALQAAATAKGAGLAATVGMVAMLTWANPHVYLDTVMLLGAVSARFEDKFAFAAGAMTGSFVFFFALGYGARLLAPVFARPRSWQVLEFGVGCVMWAIALKLLLG